MRPPDLIRPLSSSRRRDGRAQRGPRTEKPAGAKHSARTALGPNHPLTRATDALQSVARQWRACAAVLAGAIIAQLEPQPWAASLTLSAGIVLLALTALIAALLGRVRDRAIDLIAEGRETVPIAEVQRQRLQLLTRRRRRVLARTLDTIIRQATSPPKIRASGARPLFDPRVIASVAADLRIVIGLLEKDHIRARGVALAERLIVDGGSPLYAHHEKRLREEVHRVRRLLEE